MSFRNCFDNVGRDDPISTVTHTTHFILPCETGLCIKLYHPKMIDRKPLGGRFPLAPILRYSSAVTPKHPARVTQGTECVQILLLMLFIH